MDAGNGAQWHIHFSHMKLGNNNNSRVNFNGRLIGTILNHCA